MNWTGITVTISAINLIVVLVGFVFYVGRVQQQITQLQTDHQDLRVEVMKHQDSDERLFREINAGLNRLLGRQEAVDIHALLQQLVHGAAKDPT